LALINNAEPSGVMSDSECLEWLSDLRKEELFSMGVSLVVGMLSVGNATFNKT
jgi:hypothetical protein